MPIREGMEIYFLILIYGPTYVHGGGGACLVVFKGIESNRPTPVSTREYACVERCASGLQASRLVLPTCNDCLTVLSISESKVLVPVALLITVLYVRTWAKVAAQWTRSID